MQDKIISFLDDSTKTVKALSEVTNWDINVCRNVVKQKYFKHQSRVIDKIHKHFNEAKIAHSIYNEDEIAIAGIPTEQIIQSPEREFDKCTVKEELKVGNVYILTEEKYDYYRKLENLMKDIAGSLKTWGIM